MYLGEPSFPHRLNRDGTVDSICRSCFATIARERDKAELARCEAIHVCEQPIDIGNYKRIATIRLPWAHSDLMSCTGLLAWPHCAMI
jgi:hypothetical protein